MSVCLGNEGPLAAEHKGPPHLKAKGRFTCRTREPQLHTSYSVAQCQQGMFQYYGKRITKIRTNVPEKDHEVTVDEERS